MESKLHKPRKWLAVAACLFAAIPVLADTETVGDYTWTYHIENGGAVIYSGPGQSAVSPNPNGHVDIPTTLGGCPVTEIGDYAFAWCGDLTSVTIPDSVTSIGTSAFESCSLTSVIIPDSVTNIGGWAFMCCRDLTNVTIPDSVTSIGAGAFSMCNSLASLTIPAGVETICDEMFQSCSSLTGVTIPDSVTSIGNRAFISCGRLVSVTIPAYVTSIGDFAFAGCSSLTSVTLPETLREQVESKNVFADTSPTLNYYEVIIRTVTFDANGGDALEEPTISIVENHAVGALPTPARTGYVFSGWWTSLDGGERVTGDTIATADMTLYAHWQEAPYDNWRGYAPWIVEEDGSWRSGNIGDGEYSAIDVFFVGPAEVSFKWKTSSEGGYDSLRYTVCVPDGALFGGDYYTETLTGSISGEMSDWESETLQVPESGNCHLSFSYEKDGSVSDGEDCGWVKELVFSELQVPSAGFTFEENSSGGVTLTGAYNASGDIVIPSEYNGLPVTAIGDNAFRYRSGLTSVIIPDSVTNIGSGAFFHCNDLANVALGNSVTNIADHAFDCCSGLTSVTIPDSVTSIGNYAFRLCSGLTSIIIPDSVTSIGDGAFSSCHSLTSVTIPNLVTSICDYAFSNCSGLTSVILPDSVTSIGECAFDDCGSLTSVTIPESVTSIGKCAFSGCRALTSVTIPASVISIGESAFAGCSGLTSVTIADSVTSIDYQAFAYCSGLTSVTLPATLREQVESKNVFYGASPTLNYYEVPAWTVTFDTNGGDAPEEPTISVIKNRAIGALGALPTPSRTGYVFLGWWTSPDGGERVTGDTIATADMTLYAHWQKAPYDNWRGYAPWIVEEDGSWRSGDIGDGEYSAIDVYFVGPAEVSFKWKTSSESECDSLRYTVCVPDGSLFGGDYYTETLTGAISGEMSDWESKTLQVPESGNCHLSFSYEKDGSVSNGEDCGWVKELVFSELQAPPPEFTFEENSSGGVTLTDVSDASGDVVIPSEYNGLPVTAIGDNAFLYRSGLTSVTIPDSVTSIGNYAFCYCSGLTSIIIPDSVTSIGIGAFYKCNGLADYNGFVIVRDVLYSFCGQSESVVIPDSVTSIGESAFGDCTNLTSVTIPDSVTSIGSYAFDCCSGLTSVILPDSVTSIGECAFYDCGSLTSVNIPDSVTSIGDEAFASCSGLTSVTIPNSVTSIGWGAFADCSGLTSVTIGSSVTSIGNYAFAYCTQLEEVIFVGEEGSIEMNKYIAFAMTPWLPRPGNDEYENAQIVEGSEGSVAGTLAGATIADNDCIWQYDDAERTIWYKWTATFTGLAGFSATADNGENDLLYLVATRGFDYETEEWDDCGYDNGCNVTFQVAEGEVYYVSIATWNYDVTGLTLSWGEYIPPPPPANDNFADALPLAGASGSVSGTNEDATYEAEEYRPVGDSSATVWWTWRAPYSGTATFDMSGSSFDTVLAVFTGDALPSLSLVASDDDGGDSGNTSRLSFNAEAGTLYRIWVGGYSSNTGEYVLAWRLEGDGVSVAAEGVSQEYASEEEAQSASETLAVAVPCEVAAVVADTAEYRSYFTKTVRETSPGSGSYVVEAALDPEKVLPQDAEEKAALDGAVLEAALDAEAGETTLTGAKPGLYYSIVADTDLAGSFSTGGEPALCGADGSVTISKPDVSGLNGSTVFFRVKIDAYAR